MTRSLLVGCFLALCAGCGRKANDGPPKVGFTRGRERPSVGAGSACFTPDGERIIISYSTTIGDDFAVLRDVKTGKRIASLVGLSGPPLCCGFLPDGERVALACKDEVVINRIRGDLVEECGSFKTHKELGNAILAPSGRILVTIGTEAGEEELAAKFRVEGPDMLMPTDLKVWDIEERRLVHRIKGPPNMRPRMAISPDGTHLLLSTTAYHGEDNRTGEITLLRLAKDVQVLKRFPAAEGWFSPVAFSRDGKGLILGSLYMTGKGPGGDLRYWDLGLDKHTKTIKAAFVNLGVSGLRQMTDGRIVGFLSDSSAMRFRTWNWEEGSEGKDLLLGGPRMGRTASVPLAGEIWSQDGEFACTTSGRNGPGAEGIEIQIWDAKTGLRIGRWLDETGKDL